MDPEDEIAAIRRINQERGKPLAAEWESLKQMAVRGSATGDELERHRLSFHMGAHGMLRALRESDDLKRTIRQAEQEIDEAAQEYLATLKAPGRRIPLDESVYCPHTETSSGGDPTCGHDFDPEPVKNEDAYATWKCARCELLRSYEV